MLSQAWLSAFFEKSTRTVFGVKKSIENALLIPDSNSSHFLIGPTLATSLNLSKETDKLGGKNTFEVENFRQMSKICIRLHSPKN